MTRRDLKDKAISLRKSGYSYNLILKEVPVSKSTLSLWLRNIPFTPNQEVRNRIKGAALEIGRYKTKNKQLSLEKTKYKAIDKLGYLSKRDLFILGIGIYIGEGSKTTHNVRVVNSDPRLIVASIRWFEEFFNVPKENFSLAIHLYPDNNIEKSLNFWSEITGIPLKQFGKTQIDKRKKNVKKDGMLKHGTAHLSVRGCGREDLGVNLHRTINALIENVYSQID